MHVSSIVLCYHIILNILTASLVAKLYIQSTPLNRVTLGPGYFDPIKRNKGVGPINQSRLTLYMVLYFAK